MQARILPPLVLLLGTTLTWAATPATPDPATAADAIVSDFVYESLALSPVTATASGYHLHHSARLDERLDDYSTSGLKAQGNFYRGLQQRIAALDRSRLDRERLADLGIVSNNIGLSLLELERIQSFRHNPTVYVELIGNALYTPYVLEYAPKAARYQHIIARLRAVPRLLQQARANLADAPEVWNRVAQEENDGNIDLIDTTLRMEVPTELKSAYAAAATPALASLKAFNGYLKDTLSKHTSDWRLGADNYARKCSKVLDTGRSPDELLAAAEAQLKNLRVEMEKLAAPQGVKEALDTIAAQHSTPASYMDDARRDLASATAFVRERDLLTLPDTRNLQVIETPAFMRGIYGVGGFNPAPALEPQLGAFYWITPIPASWPAERVESKLREYNRFGLEHLTIHEAMPGHYVQMEYAGRVEPPARRVLRNLWGNGPYIEGWAVYTQRMMTDEGYLGGDKGLRLTLYKQLLRSVANTILDIRLQTKGMTEQQALDLMINDTYQEREEAVAKYQRAQLSSCQLDMYFAGYQAWLEVRNHYMERHPGNTLKSFHEAALKESAVPLPTLDTLLQ
ncbi:MAG: DUF885 domain-containing protein [Steroidobacteraceae bacterium]